MSFQMASRAVVAAQARWMLMTWDAVHVHVSGYACRATAMHHRLSS